MKPLQLCIFTVILLSTHENMCGKSAKADSLERVLKTAKEDTNKVNLLNEISRTYWNINPDLAYQKGQSARSLAGQLNFQKGYGTACLNVAVSCYYLSRDEEAISYLDTAYSVFDKLKDKKGLASVFNNYGLVNRKKGNFDKAVENYLKSLRLREEIGDENGAASTNANIGNIYLAWAVISPDTSNFQKAIRYYEKALKLAEKNNNAPLQAAVLTNLGSAWISLSQLLGDQMLIDNAITMLETALIISRSRGDLRNVANCINNLGNAWERKKVYDKALAYYNWSLAIRDTLKDNSESAGVHLNIARIFYETGKFDQSISSLNKGLEISSSRRDKFLTKELWMAMSNAYEGKKDHANALKYLKLHNVMKDSVMNEENQQNIEKLQAIYETEKKDKEILKSKAELEIEQANTKQKATERNAFIAGSVLFLVLSVVALKGYRDKRKANREISEAYSIIEQKNTDILDSIHYARRIQGALLSSGRLIEKQFPQCMILYKPKDIVSGDFYWAGMSGGKALLCVADCTGHGVPGAFMSLLGMTFINEITIGRKLLKPGEILDQLRNEIIRSLNPERAEGENKDGMDCTFCTIDISTLVLQYAAANHTLLLVRNGEIMELKGDKQPVGEHHRETPFTTHELQLQKGDMLYAFTDGFQDQFGGETGKKFKYKNLRAKFLEIHSWPVEQQKQSLKNALDTWKGDLEQTDDITIAGIRI